MALLKDIKIVNKKMNNKSYTVIMVFILAFIWSVWFMVNHNNPRTFKSYEEIERYCGAGYEHTEYCLGFASGYNWAAQMVELDKNLQNINWEVK